ncbi:MAG: DegV family EDD domain-containing protein [Mycoplasma sp.]|nr:DegV family EDD domain-containing protein [Mycoplasma sp.]
MEKKKIAIITDSSAGIKNQEYKNVYVLPLAVNVLEKNQNNESNLVSYKDGVDCDNAKIVKMLKNKKYTITTSQASLGEIINILDPIYDKYDEFYALPITSSTSGSENTWKIVANDHKKLHVIHQHMGGPMLQWFINDYLKMIEKGELNSKTIEQYNINAKNKIIGGMIVEDVRQLAAGGRVKTLTAFMLNILNIKVNISLDDKGMNFIKTALTYRKSIDCIFKYFANKIPNFDVKNIAEVMFIRNTNETKQKQIDQAINYVKDKLSGLNIKYLYKIMPSVLTTHAGNNSLIIAIKMK